MAYQIRPLSFAEILDRALRVLVDHAVVLIGISAIVWVPYQFLTAAGKWMALVAMILLLGVGPLVQAALTAAVVEIYLDRKATIEGAYRSAKAIFLPYLGTYLLLYIPAVVLGVPVGILAAVGMSGRRSSPAVFLLAVAVMVFVSGYFLIRWILIGSIMIAEGRFGTSALGRSWALTKGVWWRTLGISLAAALIVQVPVGALSLIWHSIPIIGTLLTGLAFSVTACYSALAMVIYYFDRRCRVEDFDLHLLAEQIRAEGAAGNAAPTGGAAPLG